MFGHTHQSTWRSFMVLLSCCLCLVNTFTVITCGHELNSAGGKKLRIPMIVCIKILTIN